MSVELGNYVEDLIPENPLPSDFVSQGDDHLRLIKTAVKQSFPGLAGRVWRHQQQGVAYTALLTDSMSVISSSASLTLSLTAASTLGNGWMCLLHAVSGDITVDPAAAELVNGAATSTISNGRFGFLLCNGTSFSLWEARIPVSGGAGTILAQDVVFFPVGNLSSTNVQAALQELDNEKAGLNSPAFTGDPTAPTPPTADNDTSIATTAYVAARIANDAPTKTGGGASGTWPINISGTAAHATTADTIATIGLGGGLGNLSTSVGGNNTNALDGVQHTIATESSFGIDLLGIAVDQQGRVTNLTFSTSPEPDGESVHPDTRIIMADGSFKWMKDIRLGDDIKGRDGPANVLGIWTSILDVRSLALVDVVACTPGHLFVTRTGWGAVSKEHYKLFSHNKRRAVKGKQEILEFIASPMDPEGIEELAVGTEVLMSDGTWKAIETIKLFPTEGPNRCFPSTHQVLSLHLDTSDIFFAEGYAVASLAVAATR